MTRKRSEIGMAVFLTIAIIEHVIFVLILATVVYTEPVSKPDRPIMVEIVPNIQPQQKRMLEKNLTVLTPAQRREQDELPPLRFTQNRQTNLDPLKSTDRIPEAIQKRLANRSSERNSLEIARHQGNRRDLVDNTPNAIVRAKPLVKTPGYHRPESRKLAMADGGKHTREKRERSSIGRLPTKRFVNSGSNRITGSENDGNIRISGEVGGRKHHLPPDIQTEGDQGGSIQLSFSVMPDGTVDRNSISIVFGPKTTVGEVRLKKKAMQYLAAIRFAALPTTVKQVKQSGEIYIKFSTEPGG